MTKEFLLYFTWPLVVTLLRVYHWLQSIPIPGPYLPIHSNLSNNLNPFHYRHLGHFADFFWIFLELNPANQSIPHSWKFCNKFLNLLQKMQFIPSINGFVVPQNVLKLCSRVKITFIMT